MRVFLSIAAVVLLALFVGSAAQGRSSDDRQAAGESVAKEALAAVQDEKAAEVAIFRHGKAGVVTADRDLMLADSLLRKIDDVASLFLIRDRLWMASGDSVWSGLEKDAKSGLAADAHDLHLDLEHLRPHEPVRWLGLLLPTGPSPLPELDFKDVHFAADMIKLAQEAAHPPCKETSRESQLSDGTTQVVFSFVCTVNVGTIEIDTGTQTVDKCLDLGGAGTCTISNGNRIVATTSDANPSIDIVGKTLAPGDPALVDVIPIAGDSSYVSDDVM